jgi:hypothetical protein
MVQDGISGKKTNHSLRVTGASCLYEAGVPEKIIQQRTGHRSLDALRMYESVTEKQEMAVSEILSRKKRKFDEPDNPDISAPFNVSAPSCVSAPSNVQSVPSCGPQYHNCTVNTFSAPNIPFYGTPYVHGSYTTYPPFPYGYPGPSYHTGPPNNPDTTNN